MYYISLYVKLNENPPSRQKNTKCLILGTFLLLTCLIYEDEKFSLEHLTCHTCFMYNLMNKLFLNK